MRLGDRLHGRGQLLQRRRANTRTLIESWDGTNWSVVPTPSPAPNYNQLNDVSCASVDACTAAGTDSAAGSNSSRTLIESG